MAYVRDLPGNLVGEFFSRYFFDVLFRAIGEAIRVPNQGPGWWGRLTNAGPGTFIWRDSPSPVAEFHDFDQAMGGKSVNFRIVVTFGEV